MKLIITHLFLCVLSLCATTVLIEIPTAEAAECQSCLARKRGLCAKECEKVVPERQVECQNTCIREYCEHRCSSDHPDLPMSATSNCDPCLDTQFNLCAQTCTSGSARIVALCKLDCAGKRCAGYCDNKSTEKAN